jgi:hypothetical protein
MVRLPSVVKGPQTTQLTRSCHRPDVYLREGSKLPAPNYRSRAIAACRHAGDNTT